MTDRGDNRAASYDIVIVGGGMVGATLALALQSTAYRVALVETAALQQVASPSYDDRSIALSYGSGRILQWLDVWQELAAFAAPILEIHVSERGRFGSARIRAQEERVPALGYVIASRRLGEVLTPRLLRADAQRLRIYSPARLLGLQTLDNAVELVVQQEQRSTTLRTRLLVAADGANSTVRRLMNIGASTIDYRQEAIITNISTQSPHSNIAYERFTETGPLALLPLADEANRCAAVWTMRAGEAQAVAALDDNAFLQRLQQRFGSRLGKLLRCGERSVYPLTLVNNDARVAGRTVFIGNAAQSLHPVAGQGFNLALRDASVLLECLLDSDVHGDPGSERLLASYREHRTRDQQRVIRFTDGLVRLFSNDLQPLSQARALGLLTLDLLPGFRRQLVQQGMGINMPLPRVGRYRQ